MSVVNNKYRSIHYVTAAETYPGRLVVSSVIWSGMTTDGHTMTLKDTAGNIIVGPLESSSELEPITVEFPGGALFNGIEVDVLGSGVVDVILQ